FFGIPILAQFLAAVVAMLGAGPAAILEVCTLLFTPTIYLLLNVFMLKLGAIIIFFSGRVWAGDRAPEKREIAAWRQCF
ncbi:phosphate ABC transporter substrate-binding protein, partial [Escherichia coli]